VLVAGTAIGFIDFDGFCWAEASHDVALFRAALRVAAASEALRTRSGPPALAATTLDRLDTVCEAFFDAYQLERPIVAARSAVWEALDLLVQGFHGFTKAKSSRLAATQPLIARCFTQSGVTHTPE
jgi:hypothetical protein